MATWIAHLRIAEGLQPTLPLHELKPYYVGNLGPDCGQANAEGSGFIPPTEISHWAKNDQKSSIEPERFYAHYLEGEWSDFYLGYYIHLLCDVLWDRNIGAPTRERWQSEFRDPEFIWTVKRDWYAHDFAFLKAHPNWAPFRSIVELGSFPNQYLDYYPRDAFERQMAVIADFYQHSNIEVADFRYLSREQYEAFITTAMTEIREILHTKAQSKAKP